VKELKNENGRPTHPRDLTRGGYKGGGAPERLYARILVGMPGTPMPASNTLKPDEVCDLVHYVRSLAPNGSE
jgi:mono/diheme cytochrome c family protein